MLNFHSVFVVSFVVFFCRDFSNISSALADRLCEELPSGIDATMDIHQLSKKQVKPSTRITQNNDMINILSLSLSLVVCFQIHQITQLLKEAKFGKPDADVSVATNQKAQLVCQFVQIFALCLFRPVFESGW